MNGGVSMSENFKAFVLENYGVEMNDEDCFKKTSGNNFLMSFDRIVIRNTAGGKGTEAVFYWGDKDLVTTQVSQTTGPIIVDRQEINLVGIKGVMEGRLE